MNIMAEPSTREELFKEYFVLQQKAQQHVNQYTTTDKNMSYLLNSLKQLATPRETNGQMNVALVVLNTRAINRIMKQVQSNTDKLKLKLKPTLSLTQRQAIGAPFKSEDFLKVIQEGEKLAEYEDLNAQASDYLLTMSEAQVIASELETFATELGNRKLKDPVVLTDIQSGMTSMEGRVKNFLGRLIDRAKTTGESLWNVINGIKNKAKNVTNNIRNFIVSSLKEIADKLREFITALVGAIFDLAAWIQRIAIVKRFIIKDFTIEVQPLEVSVLGGISIPKFQTPKLSVSFGSNE